MSSVHFSEADKVLGVFSSLPHVSHSPVVSTLHRSRCCLYFIIFAQKSATSTILFVADNVDLHFQVVYKHKVTEFTITVLIVE